MLDELNHRIDRAKHATGSYIQDQTDQVVARVVSYAVAAGLYAASAIFVMAALMVGATAGFSWIETRYGLFEAFGALAGLLVISMALFVILALYASKFASKRVVPLSNRLRVAISAAPSAEDIGPAAAVASLPTRQGGQGRGSSAAALAIASSLIGWAIMRRRRS